MENFYNQFGNNRLSHNQDILNKLPQQYAAMEPRSTKSTHQSY